MPDPREVRSMFARIAPNYDLLNRVLSVGIDQRWRRALVARAGDVRGRVVLDLCCGTGDVGLAFARQGARVLPRFQLLKVSHARKSAGFSRDASSNRRGIDQF